MNVEQANTEPKRHGAAIDIPRQVKQALGERGHLFLEEAQPPRLVRIRTNCTAVLASLTFAHGVRKVVAKPIAADAQILCPQTLCAVHERIRAQSERLAQALPRFYGFDADHRWVLMEHVPGESLLTELARTLWYMNFREHACDHYLREAATTLRAMHQLVAADLGVPHEPRSNRSYLSDFEANWTDPAIRPYLPAEYKDPQRLYDRLPASFFDRSGDRLVMSDAQPKNVLVERTGAVHFIDIDYLCGNPAIELAQFICGLDRLRLRHPLSLSKSCLFAWKECFLNAYFEKFEASVASDLLFFYPYVLMRSLRQHMLTQTHFHSYLLRFYGRRLRDFLTNVESSLPPWHCPLAPEQPLSVHGATAVANCQVDRNGTTVGLRPRLAREARPVVSVPLVIESSCCSRSWQPVTVGIPFPKGAVHDPAGLALLDSNERPVPVQTRPLALWPDSSVKWLLLDFGLDSISEGSSRWLLSQAGEALGLPHAQPLGIYQSRRSILVDTGAAQFHIDRTMLRPLSRVIAGGTDVVAPELTRAVLMDAKGLSRPARVERAVVEARGPVRATVRLEGVWEGQVPCRFIARLCFFAGTGMVRLRLTVHNPNRARHPQGLWDLGDSGSMLFRDLSLEIGLAGAGEPRIHWTAEIGQPVRATAGDLEIYQDSSGGDHWQSRNHVNREGRVPCSFRGYHLRSGSQESGGHRACPTVAVESQCGSVTAVVPEFWQQFPKALEAKSGTLRVRLFPQQFGDLFELQGGEQKTHTVWLHFGPGDEPAVAPLDWAHQPASVHATADWYAQAGVFPLLAPAPKGAEGPLGSYLQEAVQGRNSFFASREIIDEYGWRNFGEVYADHEAAFYLGPLPLVSHFNNQYDIIQGTLVQYLRSGDVRWFTLADSLARHVIDIDIYHTDKDRAQYNGGLFWFTDHYKDAATSSHRTYSRENCSPGDRSYGGGPSSNHNFTTGLLYYYYLTGNLDARAALVGLADWVINMDDGKQTPLGLIDDGPTGSASITGQLEYHGPGRGSGNSINALLDGWSVTGSRNYLDKAESLIRRSVHPADDIAALHLLNVEKRWSYTVFFSVLARFLDVKAQIEELDYMYAYARTSLLHYAGWMLENERPYLDHPEQLEYPTETWAAQEFRKANVLRLAAAHAQEPLRGRLLKRGTELADRAWSDLLRFDSRFVARAVALMMLEGTVDSYFRSHPVAATPPPAAVHNFGAPAAFMPQKLRVGAQLRTVRGLLRATLRGANVRNWLRVVRHR